MYPRYFLILALFCFSCNNSRETKEEEVVETKKDSVVDNNPKYCSPEYFLNVEGEKIVVISKVVNIVPYKIAQIISVYEDSIMGTFDAVKVIQTIDKIAIDTKVSEKTISAIIFMYKYDTLVKEDYENEIVEEYQDNQTDYNTSDYEINTGR